MIIHTSNCQKRSPHFQRENFKRRKKVHLFTRIAPETVFQGDADVENLYKTDSFRGFKSDTFFFLKEGELKRKY